MPPLYDFHCEACGQYEEHYAGMHERVIACQCGGEMRRQITTRYYINPDIEVVTDNIDGQMRRITSRQELKERCRDAGVMEKYGKGWV